MSNKPPLLNPSRSCKSAFSTISTNSFKVLTPQVPKAHQRAKGDSKLNCELKGGHSKRMNICNSESDSSISKAQKNLEKQQLKLDNLRKISDEAKATAAKSKKDLEVAQKRISSLMASVNDTKRSRDLLEDETAAKGD